MKTKTTQKFMRIIRLSLLMLLLLPLGPALAGEKVDVISGERFTMHSSALDEDRVITVSFPDNYEASSQNYPVLYLLDGRAHFVHATAAVNFLSARGIIPQMIVVSIHNVDRNRDFSPVRTENFPNTGGAGKFLEFVSGELVPHIREHYRTSGFSVIMGHSFGGTFITYALLAKPEVFDGYIAISPYLQYAENHVVEEAKNLLRSDFDSRKYYYMTIGNEPDYFPVLEEFASLMEEKPDKAIAFSYVKMADENHRSIPYISLFNGLRFIFSGWQLPDELYEKGLKDIDEHYKNVSMKYGFEIKTPENVINILGYRYLQNNEIEKAIEVFRENVKRYPGSANVYDSLGEAYENNGQLTPARENYKKAYEMGTAQDDPNTPIYKKNFDRVSQK
jgi:predicted alpha/beta superfamily hydrolase